MEERLNRIIFIRRVLELLITEIVLSLIITILNVVGILTISLGFLTGNKAEDRFHYADTNLLIG